MFEIAVNCRRILIASLLSLQDERMEV